MEKKKMRIAFIGGGAIGEAMVQCLLNEKVAAPQDIVVSDTSQVRRDLLSGEYGVRALPDNKEAVKNADLIVLAVKPQNLAEVMDEIRGLTADQLVLSIVAGAALSSLRRGLNHSCVVRAIPNMPAQIGQGMTIWTATTETDQRQRKVAQT